MGRYGRVRATQLLRFPAFAPVLAGLTPYERCRRACRTVLWDPDALAEFPYDWRLPAATTRRCWRSLRVGTWPAGALIRPTRSRRADLQR